MNTVAYPTRHNGVLYRSRLEARWAAFFDLLGWPYAYEPFDLKGYIPDFVLQFHEPLLVEVKPELYFKDLEQHAGKIKVSGWDKEILIVGASLFGARFWPGCDVIGLLGETSEYWPGWSLGEGILMWCTHCNRPSIRHAEMSFECRVSGCYDGDHYVSGFLDGPRLWATAGEETQWHPGAKS